MYNYISKIILILSAILVTGCNLLTTRDAEEPEVSRTLNLPATTVDQLFLNVRNSLSEKVAKDYISCFVDSSFTKVPFSFIPSSSANFKYDVFANWNLEAEEKYFNNVVNAIGVNGNVFLSLALLENSIDGTSQTLSYSYKLTLPFIDESTPQLFEGIAIFTVIQDNYSQWVIAEWNDIENGDAPTWSELKGRFYIF